MDAGLLLGHVVREPGLLLDARRSAHELRPTDARAVIAALGIMGVSSDFEALGGEMADSHEVSARAFGKVFADGASAADGPIDAVDKVNAAGANVLPTAHHRILQGRFLSAAG
jgi:hypothetical protein